MSINDTKGVGGRREKILVLLRIEKIVAVVATLT